MPCCNVFGGPARCTMLSLLGWWNAKNRFWDRWCKMFCRNLQATTGITCTICFAQSTVCNLPRKISTWWERRCSRSLSLVVRPVCLREWYCTFTAYIHCTGSARRHAHGADAWAFCCMPAEQWCCHFGSGARRWRPDELVAVVGGTALWWGACHETVWFIFVLIMFKFVVSVSWSLHVKLLRCAFLRATTTSTPFPALWHMYLEIILWRMFAR